MAAGMVFAALAFGAATIVERAVIETVVETPPASTSLVQVLNLAEGDVSVNVQGHLDLFPQPLISYEDPVEYKTLELNGYKKALTFTVTFNGGTHQCVESFTEGEAYTLVISSNAGAAHCSLAKDNIQKSENGEAHLRFINTISEDFNITVGEKSFQVPPGIGSEVGVSNGEFVDRDEYSNVKCESSSRESTLDIGLVDFGASYSIVLRGTPENIEIVKMEDVRANNVHIAWQVPQYVLITAGEVMFSITGLEFSYSQAPANMKSVLQAGWLMTVAFGNVIVLIVAEGAGMEQWMEFLLFGGLLIAVCIIFSIMAYFYTYVDPDHLDKQWGDDKGVDGEDDLKKENKDGVHMRTIGERGQSTKM